MALLLTTCQAAIAEPGFAGITRHLGAELGLDVQFIQDVGWHERRRRFERGEIDVAWICGAPYVRAVARGDPIELLAAPVCAPARYGDRPVYFSDVMVRSDSPFHAFADLRGARLSCNNHGSHSGYEVVRYALATRGLDRDFFGSVHFSGAHERSMQLIAAGQVDVSAIDSTVVDAVRAANPDLCDQLRTIEVLGPSAQPPWVIGTQVPEPLRMLLREALTRMHLREEGRAALRRAGLARFATVVDADYDDIRRMARVADDARIVL